jgi:lipopolysaccharide/colanic/teichoic acid biosynthesis glycosyltransferase
VDPDILAAREAAEPLPQHAAVVRQPTAKPDRNPAPPENGAVAPRHTPTAEQPHDPARFAQHYVHPGFPCKDVPYLRVKRTFDILLAIGLLSITWPAMLAAAVLIKLTSRGPVIFRQVRVGRGGRYFVCYKFRSMCADAESRRRALQHLNEMDGPVFKIKHDPRITPVGAFIRKFSIDELPQLVNVLHGDMSIVGPRPPVPSEVEVYSQRERGRLAVQPGLTCLWQVNGRNNIAFNRWIELDLHYIETMSFMNDVRIVLKTVPAVITGSGAH